MTDLTVLISQGCDYKAVFSIYEEDGSSPFDLSGYTGTFRVAKKDLSEKYIDIEGSVNELNSSVNAGSVNIPNPTEGKVYVNIKPHNANKLPTNNIEGEESLVLANNIYSLIIDNGLKRYKVYQGPCAIEPEL